MLLPSQSAECFSMQNIALFLNFDIWDAAAAAFTSDVHFEIVMLQYQPILDNFDCCQFNILKLVNLVWKMLFFYQNVIQGSHYLLPLQSSSFQPILTFTRQPSSHFVATWSRRNLILHLTSTISTFFYILYNFVLRFD